MPDDPQQKKRPLSEISHLFLSSVRDRQTGGAQRPQRTPPPRSDLTIDLTPEEFAQVYGDPTDAGQMPRKSVPMTAVIAAHLNGTQFDRARQYARHLAGQIGRVGLIELDGSELRLTSFEPDAPGAAGEAEAPPPECAEPRQMTEALEEMNWDVSRWLLLLPNPRTPEAKALLRQIDHWVLLSTSDHDGVVSSYRMLKGLAEIHHPRLTLSLLDSGDDAHIQRVHQKLAGVCEQFLDWRLEAEPALQPASGIAEHLALLYRPTRDKAQLATAPQWAVVSEFLAAAKLAEAATHPKPSSPDPEETLTMAAAPPSPQQVADVVVPRQPIAFVSPSSDVKAVEDSVDEVIDLAGPDVSGDAILAAVLRKARGSLIECPVRPPMCAEARLAVSRDRGLVLLAAAGQGLVELRSIVQAFRWLRENQQLIGMALPQFAINLQHPPKLRLLVDRADTTTDLLQPLLENEHVELQAYRRLRWGEKLGLFLEAA